MSVVVLIFSCVFSYMDAQSKSDKKTESQLPITAPAENGVSLEETLPIKSASSDKTPDTDHVSTFRVFFRMIIVLIFVVACMYAVMKFMKNGLQRPENTDPFLRKVSSVAVSPGKSVSVVTLLDHAYIIGVSDSSINLIGQVDDKELVDAMNLYADKQSSASKPRNFNDILALFMPNSAENKNVFKNSAKEAADLLKKQRERLHGSDNGGES